MTGPVEFKLWEVDGEPHAVVERHGCPVVGNNNWSSLPLDVPGNEHVPADGKWQLESIDPLTISPSVLCRNCGRHGFIREGKWVEA